MKFEWRYHIFIHSDGSREETDQGEIKNYMRKFDANGKLIEKEDAQPDRPRVTPDDVPAGSKIRG